MNQSFKMWIVASKFLAVMTVLTGLIYPVVMTVFAQVFHQKANGSLIESSGQIVGSELIAQGFQKPEYFWPRPSAIGYNPLPSGGSNLGPLSSDLLNQVKERSSKGMKEDLLFASASGLDPHISPEAALSQASRVATARQVSEESIRSIVNQFIESRQLGFLGEPRVNVLKLNLALDKK